MHCHSIKLYAVVSCALFDLYLVNTTSKHYKVKLCDFFLSVPLSSFSSRRPKERSMPIETGRRQTCFLPFHFFSSDAARGHRRRNDGSSILPSAQLGCMPWAEVIYDAVKSYTAFSVASPRVTVLSKMPLYLTVCCQRPRTKESLAVSLPSSAQYDYVGMKSLSGCMWMVDCGLATLAITGWSNSRGSFNCGMFFSLILY